jgi:8-oxo-dGTP pyrophosphatase MutT (NUDIX family)
MGKPKNYLPENAKMVFQGKIYAVWQWEQKMYDGSLKVFEKLKKADQVSVIAVIDNQIMIQEQKQPHRNLFLSLPGGMCDGDEDPIESVKREFLEETGYVSDKIFLWKKIPSAMSSIISDKYFYIAKKCKKVQDQNTDNGEKIKNKFINFKDFLMLSEDEKFRDADFVHILLQMRLHPEEQQEFEKLLFS